MQTRFLPVLMLCLLLTGCGGREPPAGLQGTVSTDGSTSMADVMAVLQEAFKEQYPGVTVNYSGTGSGAGVEAALSGACDIGLTSRELRPEEAAQGAAAHLIALDAVAVVVNPCRPLEDLSLERLAGIFTGRITTWDQLGCGEGPIAVYGREAGSGTRTAFEDLAGVADRCAYTNIYGSTGDVVGSVASNPNAIGYASLAAVGEGVKVLAIDGVRPSEEAIQAGEYPICRSFYLVTAGEEGLSPAARDFLDYAQGPGAEPYLRAAGAVPPARSASGREGYP